MGWRHCFFGRVHPPLQPPPAPLRLCLRSDLSPSRCQEELVLQLPVLSCAPCGNEFQKALLTDSNRGTLGRPCNVNPGSVLPAADLAIGILSPQVLCSQMQRYSVLGKSQLTDIFSTSIA